ncbi:hypothetical protein EK21DRAFT_91287 [Setomelanomma holmii]|uniref:Uncharacterized protein n=1 Tax=Setomelanomma holmii TaxID=210430 RepID=A0A9P4LK28_9PLEO|nr:hypothetical protein EK21DRAFT_91287 [Setomelanomma holmii]
MASPPSYPLRQVMSASSASQIDTFPAHSVSVPPLSNQEPGHYDRQCIDAPGDQHFDWWGGQGIGHPGDQDTSPPQHNSQLPSELLASRGLWPYQRIRTLATPSPLTQQDYETYNNHYDTMELHSNMASPFANNGFSAERSVMGQGSAGANGDVLAAHNETPGIDTSQDGVGASLNSSAGDTSKKKGGPRKKHELGDTPTKKAGRPSKAAKGDGNGVPAVAIPSMAGHSALVNWKHGDGIRVPTVPPKKDDGMFFNTFEEAQQAMSGPAWTPPANDKVPTNDAELKPFVRCLYNAIIDISQFEDKRYSSKFQKRWLATTGQQGQVLTNSFHMPHVSECLAWEIANTVQRLHLDGPGELDVHDAVILEDSYADAGLMFEYRISHLEDVCAKRATKAKNSGSRANSIAAGVLSALVGDSPAAHRNELTSSTPHKNEDGLSPKEEIIFQAALAENKARLAAIFEYDGNLPEMQSESVAKEEHPEHLEPTPSSKEDHSHGSSDLSSIRSNDLEHLKPASPPRKR